MEPGKKFNDEDEMDVLDQLNQDQKKKKRMAIIGASSIIVIALGGYAFVNTGSSDSGLSVFSKDENNAGSHVNKDDNNASNENNASTSDNVVTSTFPIELADWETKSYHNNPDKGQIKYDMLVRYAPTDLAVSGINFMSESSGYHIGGPMDDYQVNVTYEEYIAATGEYIERLINPSFGGWSMAQYSNINIDEEFPIDVFSDMFSNSFKERNKDRPYRDYIPVYADWDMNDYGNSDLSNVSRWHGKMKNLSSTVSGESLSPSEIKVDTDIIYTSLTNNGSTVTKEGVLSLVLTQGYDGQRPLVIEDAKLTIK